jgi:hypothetical protein
MMEYDDKFQLDPTIPLKYPCTCYNIHLATLVIISLCLVMMSQSGDITILLQFHHVSFLNQQSIFLLDLMAHIISPFFISRVGRLENFLPLTFLVSEKLIPCHMSLLNQRSRSYRDFTTSRAFVMPDQWSTISMIRRSISFHDLTYHKFPHHALLIPLMCKLAKFQSLATCCMIPTVRIVIAILHIPSLNLFPLDFLIFKTPK